MGRFGNYKMLLGEPCRCYFKNDKGEYQYVMNAYYVGRGYCVRSFSDVAERLLYQVLKFDRYIPIRLYNKEYLYELQNKGYTNQKPINNPDFELNDFNTNDLIDFYEGHLDEFWWWKEIQDKVREELSKE